MGGAEGGPQIFGAVRLTMEGGSAFTTEVQLESRELLDHSLGCPCCQPSSSSRFSSRIRCNAPPIPRPAALPKLEIWKSDSELPVVDPSSFLLSRRLSRCEVSLGDRQQSPLVLCVPDHKLATKRPHRRKGHPIGLYGWGRDFRQARATFRDVGRLSGRPSPFGREWFFGAHDTLLASYRAGEDGEDVVE